MALINCPECGKEMSYKALRCPNCGYERKKQRPKTGCIDGLCLFTTIFALIASAGGFVPAILITIVWFFVYQFVNLKYKSDPLVDNKNIKSTLNAICAVFIIQLLIFSCSK